MLINTFLSEIESINKTFQHPRQKISPDFIDSKLQNYSNISSGGERVITPENDAH